VSPLRRASLETPMTHPGRVRRGHTASHRGISRRLFDPPLQRPEQDLDASASPDGTAVDSGEFAGRAIGRQSRRGITRPRAMARPARSRPRPPIRLTPLPTMARHHPCSIRLSRRRRCCRCVRRGCGVKPRRGRCRAVPVRGQAPAVLPRRHRDDRRGRHTIITSFFSNNRLTVNLNVFHGARLCELRLTFDEHGASICPSNQQPHQGVFIHGFC
jgi:hypothetical protein